MASRLPLGIALALIACATPPDPLPYRDLGPLAEPAAPAGPVLRVLIIGDNGDPSRRQREVSRAFVRWGRSHPFDLVLQPGDNVYNCGANPRLPGAEACRFAPDGATLAPGVRAPRDPLFERNEGSLRALRGPDGAPVPVYLALGNHDVGAQPFCRVPRMARDEAMRRRACLEVAHRSPWWTLPARHYVLDRGGVRFVVIDSNVAVEAYGGFTLAEERAFVREATAPCDERTCFLVAHHPPAFAVVTPGAGPDPSHEGMSAILGAATGRVAAVLAGHAHSLQHLSLDGVDVLIAGSTSRGGRHPIRVPAPASARVHFAVSAAGFAVLEVRPDGWTWRAVDRGGRQLYCCEAAGRGPCAPARCAPPR